MKKLSMLTILLVSFLLLGCGNKNTTTNPTTNLPTNTATPPTNEGEDVVEDEGDDSVEANDPQEVIGAPGENTIGKKAGTGYTTYNEAVVQAALDEGKKVALFFHASRCPNCTALHANIEANFTTIPADTIIFKVDYDTSDDLKEKYGVTSQHTLVYIDADKDAINKVVGPTNLDEVLAAFVQ